MSKSTDHELSIDFLKNYSKETPFFVFSKKKIVEKITEFKKLFPNSFVHYAMKANSEQEVLETVQSTGAGFEVASVYELNMLKKIKVDPTTIIYGSSIKPAQHIKEFFEYGVDRYAFDCVSELEKIAAMAPGSKVYVRTVVNDAGSVFKFSEKFGTEIENIVPLLLNARELGLKPYGISFNVGSQASNPKAWAHAIENLKPIISELLTHDIKLEILNLGGGYPCQYASGEIVPSLSEIAELVTEKYKELPYQPKLLMEPGRGIVAEAGVLVATIVGKVQRRGNSWLFIDAGVYNAMFEAMAYQGSTRYPLSSMRSTFSSGEKLFAVAGPTGDAPDIITKEALLPQDIEVGEKIVINNVGAYSLTVCSPFNGFPKPSVYFV